MCSYITVTCGVIHDYLSKTTGSREKQARQPGLHCDFNRKLLAAAAAHVHKKTELKASGGRRPSQTTEAAGGAHEFFSCIYRKHFWLLSFQRDPQRVLSNGLLSRLSRVLSAGSQQDGRVKSMF